VSLFIEDPTPDEPPTGGCCGGDCPCRAGAGLLVIPQGVEFPPDDPTPTTGGPVEYEFPEGCVCHIREDIDYGDRFVAPPEGCRVHTPWAFPGYSLTAEAIAADFPTLESP
jgi:hypothetical protein